MGGARRRTGRHALSLPRGYPERGAVAGCVQRATVVQRVAYQCSHGSGRCLKCAEVRGRPDREERNVAKARVPTLPPGRLHGPKGGVPAAGDRGRAGGRVRSALSAARRRDWLLLIPRDGWSCSSERQRDRPRRYPGVLAARSLNAPLPVVSHVGALTCGLRPASGLTTLPERLRIASGPFECLWVEVPCTESIRWLFEGGAGLR